MQYLRKCWRFIKKRKDGVSSRNWVLGTAVRSGLAGAAMGVVVAVAIAFTVPMAAKAAAPNTCSNLAVTISDADWKVIFAGPCKKGRVGSNSADGKLQNFVGKDEGIDCSLLMTRIWPRTYIPTRGWVGGEYSPLALVQVSMAACPSLGPAPIPHSPQWSIPTGQSGLYRAIQVCKPGKAGKPKAGATCDFDRFYKVIE